MSLELPILRVQKILVSYLRDDSTVAKQHNVERHLITRHQIYNANHPPDSAVQAILMDTPVLYLSPGNTRCC